MDSGPEVRESLHAVFPLCHQALQARWLVVFVALVVGTLCQADGSSFKNTEGGKRGGTEKAESVQ